MKKNTKTEKLNELPLDGDDEPLPRTAEQFLERFAAKVNTGHLVDIGCPFCGNRDEFEIECNIPVNTTFTDREASFDREDLSEPSFSGQDTITCFSCGESDLVTAFTFVGLDKLSADEFTFFISADGYKADYMLKKLKQAGIPTRFHDVSKLILVPRRKLPLAFKAISMEAYSAPEYCFGSKGLKPKPKM